VERRYDLSCKREKGLPGRMTEWDGDLQKELKRISREATFARVRGKKKG